MSIQFFCPSSLSIYQALWLYVCSLRCWSWIQTLYPDIKLNLEDRVLGEGEKNCFALPSKGGQSGLMPSKLCVPTWGGQWGVEEGVISSWTFFWLIGGEVNGSQQPQPFGSNRSGIYVLVGSTQLTSPTWWGFQDLQNSSKILLCISVDGEPGPCPKAALLFLLTVPLLSLHPISSLINNCLNLPLGAQGRLWRMNEAYFP